MSTSGTAHGDGLAAPSGGAGRSQEKWSWMNRLEIALGAISAVVGSLAALLHALAAVSKTAEELATSFGLRGPTSQAAVIVVALVGIWLVYLGSRRRSRLLRPEALNLHVDDLGYLPGRAGDLLKLASLCRDRSLVFLVGESGAGKSALVRAGLCRDTEVS